MKELSRQEYLEYAPHLYMDEKDPFPVRLVGVNCYGDGEESRSFRRSFDLQDISPDTADVLEYACYMDYDIQHLYELEHVWIYRNEAGEITGAEGSCHGKYLNAWIPGKTQMDGRHVRMYAQPGKHAMAAFPEVFDLMPGRNSAVGRLAGTGGLDAPEKYLQDIRITPEENDRVKAYIREQFAFIPAWRFREIPMDPSLFLPWEEVQAQIPRLIREQLRVILGKDMAN